MSWKCDVNLLLKRIANDLFKYSKYELTNDAGMATTPSFRILYKKTFRFYSIIALTICPLTEAT